MKKSQILSAIALAAALGVIAPVAGVSAYKEPANGDHGTASCADSATAAKAIKANSRYASAVAFLDAAKAAYETKVNTDITDHNAYNVTQGDFAWLGKAMIAKYQAVAVEQGDAGQYFTSTKMTANNNKIQKYVDEATTDWTADMVKEVLDGVKSTKGYDKVYKIWKARKNNDKAAFNAAVAGYNEVMTFNINNANAEWGNWTVLDATGNTAYKAFAALFAEVEKTEDQYNDYAKSLKALTDAYNRMKSAGLITALGADAYKTATDGKFVLIEDLASVVLNTINGNNKFHDANVANDENIDALYEIVVDFLDACNVQREDGVIYDSIIAAAYNYGRINNLKVASDEDKQIVARSLVNYTAPEDNKDTDTTIDAPQSGILGMAEGSASAVSIAAGLATALTALGAGVVAYRSARRSK